MRHAVLAERGVGQRIGRNAFQHQAVDVVEVARDALAAAAEGAAAFEPPAMTMQNNHLVPEGTLGLERDDVGYIEVYRVQFVGNVRTDNPRTMRVERGLRA